MLMTHENVVSLLDYVKIDRFYVSCHFKCKVKNKTIVSIVPFEPYDGKIVITFKQMLRNPIKSYNRYYHTPITIYGNDCHETIVLKAFKKVSNKFTWNQEEEKYIYN
ncbi:MAG: hypothetical protein AUK54_04040 [Helicobacteraceae bacterium CG2_30_36_10]|nr:MAG: hypothetical protein AUK54_04040 [Helicobacteraceae bacterium CG2_30_36_10]